ncbi:MAG: cyclodeaminase/cyclohydrolase family protein [Pseudobutyrivibrio sp.]|nr:cyclodeaminase/cyclohydrolase family protein [Pseudobutyrivibrio sp.]
MKITESSVVNFTEALASKTSVPGGGGASALVASIGIALGDMVGEFTVGKKKYAKVEPEIRELMLKAQDLRVELLECVEKDAISFEPLSKAYGLPKDAPNRDEIMETCLRDAATVPFEIMQLAAKAIKLQKEFAEKGSVIMISDAATGAALLEGALKGAAVNVFVNTKLMKDRQYAEELNSRVNELLNQNITLANEIYDSVVARI